MSGIEVAGLVLGAIPLIISAIEHYESSLDRAKVFFKWQDVLEKARRDLWVQYSSYEMTLRILLVDLANEAELEELLSEPQSTLWDNPELIQGLRDKLGETYQVYVYTIKQMESCVKTLARHLDIDRRDAASADDLEAILEANRPVPGSQQQGHIKFEFRRRIKLTIKRRDIRQLLSNIKECNDQLDLFITKARNVEQASPLQSAQKRSKFSLSMPLQQVYDHAAHLHRVLCEAWACGVHASHRAHLLLEHRMVRKGRKKQQLRTYGGSNSQEGDQANFTLALKGTGDTDTATWYLAEVKVLDEPVLPPRSAGIKFNISPPSGPEDLSLLGSASESISSLEVVQDICSSYSSTGHACLGFCLDLTSQTVLRGTYPATQRPICVGHNLVSLEEVLFSTDNKWQPLTQEDRYVLCITLVASFLQLYKTPWVGDRWSERDIHFFEQPPDATTGQAKRADIQHAFVSKTYTSSGATTTTTTTTTTNQPPGPATTIFSPPTTTTHDDSLNLLTLARILLEIRCGRRIETLRSGADLGPGARPNEATDLQTLKRWVQQEKGNLSFALRDAVGYCMAGFANPETDLRDPGCRMGVVEGVVVPLWEELGFFRGVV